MLEYFLSLSQAKGSLAEAFDDAYYLERAAMFQYKACLTGQHRLINEKVVDITFNQFEKFKKTQAICHLNGFLEKYNFK